VSVARLAKPKSGGRLINVRQMVMGRKSRDARATTTLSGLPDRRLLDGMSQSSLSVSALNALRNSSVRTNTDCSSPDRRSR
jgi:hypothetical protein